MWRFQFRSSVTKELLFRPQTSALPALQSTMSRTTQANWTGRWPTYLRPKTLLWPPPFEALAAGPVLAMLVVVAWLRSLSTLPVVLAFALAGTLLLWMRGAHRRAFPIRLSLRVLDALLALSEAAALAYVILDGGGALDNIVLTLTAGPA